MTTYPIPQLSVEIAFDDPSVSDDDLTWVDVSDDVRRQGVHRSQGRADERASLTDPGTLTVTLDNASGVYTPGASASPYYPYVLPWRRIRVSLMTSPTHAVFYGFITSWRLTWDAPGAPTVELTAVDCLALLRRRALRSVLAEEIMLDGPVAYWPLSEQDGAAAALSITGSGSPMVPVGDDLSAIVFGSGTGPPKDSASAVQIADIAGAGGLRSVATGLPAVAADGWALSMEAFIAPSVSCGIVNVGSGDGLFADLNAGASQTTLSVTLDGSTFGLVLTGPSIVDTRTHHVAASISTAGGTLTAELFVDGVSRDVDSGALTATGLALSVATVGAGGGASLSHIAVYSTEMSAARVQAHYDAGMTGFAGESTVARLTRWAGYVGETIAYTPGHEGTALGHIDTTGKTVLDCIDVALATDHGAVLYASQVGRQLEYYARDEARYGAASSVTLDCADRQVDADLTATIDDTRIAARVKVPTPSGDVTVTNAAVLAAYGEIGLDVQAAPASNADARALAEWLAAETATPTPRIAQVSTNLIAMAQDSAEFDPTAIPVLGELVSLVNLPDTAPTTSLDAFVEGVEEVISVDEWRITANLSPAEPWTKVWTVGDPVLGKLDGSTVWGL